MKKIILSFCFSSLFLSVVSADNYSLLVEEDSQGIMVVYYSDSGFYGEIIQFGGYDWFKDTYSNPSELVATFIQPYELGTSGTGMESYMQTRYLIKDFEHTFKIKNDDHILSFRSKNAFQRIVGYLTRNESFSFASLTEETWYAGGYSPVKKTDDLIQLANKNQMTFCMLIEHAEKITGENVDLKTDDIRSLMSQSGFNCNSNFLLK